MVDKVLEMADHCFSDYLMNKMSRDVFESKMGHILSALPLDTKKTFTVSVVNEKQKEPFFGFRIFPVQEQLDQIAELMTNTRISFKELLNHWKVIPEWYIEVDANVFDKYSISFTPKELTAMVLHEIGHTIYSEKNLSIMYNAFKEAQTRMKVADKASMKVLYMLYMVPLSIGCMQKNFVNAKNEINIEFYADKALKEYGYTEYLISALDKIIKTYGSQNQSDANKKQKVMQSVQWCNLNTSDLARRKEKLKDELYYQSLKSESKYFKAICFQVLNKIGFKMRERYSGAVVECTMQMLDADARFGPEQVPALEFYAPMLDLAISTKLDRAWEMVQSGYRMDLEAAVEGVFGSRNRKKQKGVKLPSQHEIDEIEVQLAHTISNYHDKMFLLDQVYDLLDRIDLYEELHANDPNYATKDAGRVADLRANLNRVRKAILEKPLPKKELKLFVEVPSGYEG